MANQVQPKPGQQHKTKLLTSLPNEFIDTGRLGPPYSPHPRIDFEPQTKRYTLKASALSNLFESKTAKERDKFRAKVNEFQLKCKSGHFEKVDLRKSQTWDEVEDLLKQGVKRYSDKDGVSNAVSKFFTKLGKSGQAVNAWMGLLPSGEYSSIACGGFKLIVSAALHIAVVRDSVLEAVASIPKTLERATRLQHLYDTSPEFQEEITDLYLAILQASAFMLDWLAKTSKWDKIKMVATSILKQDNYADDLNDALKKIDKCVVAVNDEASVIAQFTLRRIEDNETLHFDQLNTGQRELVSKQQLLVTGHQQIANGQQLLVAGQQHLADNHSIFMQSFNRSQQDLANSQEMIAADQRALLGKQDQSIKGNEVIVNLLQTMHDHLLEELTQAIAKVMKDRDDATAQRPSPIKARGPTSLELCRVLEYNPEEHVRDLQQVLRRAGSSTRSEQDRTTAVLSHNTLKDWLTAPGSKMILIDGNAPTVDPISSMSFTTALLIKSVPPLSQASSIFYFCAQNLDAHDPNTGARALLSSLICQLTMQFQYFNLVCVDKAHLGKQVGRKQRNLETLCTIFRSMVLQLGDTDVLFCLVDGVKFYEYAGREKGFLLVLDTFKKLMSSRDVRATLKFCFANPTTSSRNVRRYFAQEQILRLPSQVTRRSIALNTRHWQEDASKTVGTQYGHSSRKGGDSTAESESEDGSRSSGRSGSRCSEDSLSSDDDDDEEEEEEEEVEER